MKKFFAIFALVAMLLPLSCNKDNKKDGAVADLSKKPSTAVNAWKVEIPADAQNESLGEGVGVPTSAERTDGDELIITSSENKDGETLKHVFTGHAQKVDENTLRMVDERTKDQFEVQFIAPKGTGYSVKITYKGKTYTFNANPVGEFSADPVIVTALARRFQVLQTTIAVELPENKALAAAHSEPGCDLPAIANYMKEAGGVEFDYDFTGYVVKEIEFSSRGTVIIRFTGQDPYEGEMVKLTKGNDNKYSFEYDLDVKDGDNNPIFNGKANGLVEPDFTKGRINLVLNAKGSTKKKEEYKATVQLLVAPIVE